MAAAYGWPVTVAGDPGEVNARLLALNRSIACGEVAYAPFDQWPGGATDEREGVAVS